MSEFKITGIKGLKFYNKDGTPLIDSRDAEPVEKKFNSNKDVVTLLKNATVPYEYWNDERFTKYGYGASGISDYWQWKPSLNNAEEYELWRMLAICEGHYRNQYEYWYRKEVKNHRDYMREKGDLPKELAISIDLEDFDISSLK